MKKIILLAFTFVIITSCKKNNEAHNSILGTWNCEHYSDYDGNKSYQASITVSPEYDSLFVVSNFHNLGIDYSSQVYVKKDADGNLVIKNVLVNNNILISGKGVVASDFSEIKWSYTLNKGMDSEIVEALYY